jgi:hypothetical protein
MTNMTSKLLLALTALGALACACLIAASPAGAAPKFYADDPILREPAAEDASKTEEWDVDLIIDLAANSFAKLGEKSPDVRAEDINTIDEVPDSDWFTNRILAKPLTIDEVAKGPLVSGPPDTTSWAVTRPKKEGAAPGFTARDGRGDLWFISFDAKGHPEAATGAILVANKIFYTLGYWQVENYLVRIQPEKITIADDSKITPKSGKQRPMRKSDLDRVWKRAHRSEDGSYRAIAAKALEGKILNGFKYYETRPDDPNDVIPHEHRRSLRALQVFGAWTNLMDMKTGNTLDALQDEGGKKVVRHYLQDVGSTFGTGANGPHEWSDGWEYLYERDKLVKRLVTLGIYTQPWETVDYEDNEAIGRFEGKEFDPITWKPRTPNPALVRARPDDTFWAVRRVMAFTDDMIRAMVGTGEYSNPGDAKLLADVLIQRRDKIGRTYLVPINPLVDFKLENGTLSFENAAVAAHVAEAPKAGYPASWFSFDNATGATSPIGMPLTGTGTGVPAPADLDRLAGEFVKVQVAAIDPPHEEWKKPVDVYFRNTGDSWKLVGLERLP